MCGSITLKTVRLIAGPVSLVQALTLLVKVVSSSKGFMCTKTSLYLLLSMKTTLRPQEREVFGFLVHSLDVYSAPHFFWVLQIGIYIYKLLKLYVKIMSFMSKEEEKI